jgi:hypothetical protein
MPWPTSPWNGLSAGQFSEASSTNTNEPHEGQVRPDDTVLTPHKLTVLLATVLAGLPLVRCPGRATADTTLAGSRCPAEPPRVRWRLVAAGAAV